MSGRIEPTIVQVHSGLYDDPAFEQLSVGAKLVFLWRATRPHDHFESTEALVGVIGFEVGLEWPDAEEALAELEADEFARLHSTYIRPARGDSPDA